jgi:hypothetical protein
MNQTIGTAISKYTNHPDSLKRWDIYLDGILMGYRSMPQASTKFTPFYLTHGHEPQLPINLEYPLSVAVLATIHKRIFQLLAKFEPDLVQVHQNIQNVQAQQKRAYDATVTSRMYEIRDIYQSQLQIMHNVKLVLKWNGPYFIDCILEHKVYKLRDDAGNRLKQLVHGNCLKPHINRHAEPVVLIEQHPVQQ